MQRDIIAGLSVGAMVIPQGMSYANLAGLPYVFGGCPCAAWLSACRMFLLVQPRPASAAGMEAPYLRYLAVGLPPTSVPRHVQQSWRGLSRASRAACQSVQRPVPECTAAAR